MNVSRECVSSASIFVVKCGVPICWVGEFDSVLALGACFAASLDRGFCYLSFCKLAVDLSAFSNPGG